MNLRRQSTTTHPLPIYMKDASGNPVAGQTVAAALSKDGGVSFGAAAGAVTEAANGLYWLAGNAADRDTLGDCVVKATCSGAVPTVFNVLIVPFDVFQSGPNGLAIKDGNGNVQADVARWAGTIIGLVGGKPDVNVASFTAGAITGAALPATGFTYGHGIDLSSDQGGPGVFVHSNSGFSALTISNTGGGNAVSVSGSVSIPTVVLAIWNALLTTLTVAGSVGKKLADAVFGSLTGTSSVTLTFVDNLAAPVPNVEFTVAGQGTMRANASGVAAFSLFDGSYTVLAAPQNTILFPTTALTVSGTTALTITGASANIPVPPSPAQTTAYGTTRDAHGNPKGAVPVTFQLLNADLTTDIYDGGTFTSTSDSSGNLTVVLLKGAQYRIKTANGKYEQFATSSDATQPLPNVLGGF